MTDESTARHLATLRELNHHYVRSVGEADVEWFDRHLSDDFHNTNPDGTLIDAGRVPGADRPRLGGEAPSRARREDPPAGRLRHHPCADQLHQARRQHRRRLVHRRLATWAGGLALRFGPRQPLVSASRP